MRTVRLIIIVFLLALLSACDTGPYQLRLIVPTEPEDRSIVEDLSNLLDDDAAVRVRLTESPLSEEAALDAIVAGDADIAQRMNLGADEYRYVSQIEDVPDIVIVFSPISPERMSAVHELHDGFSDFQL
jgi:hypothetical protein